MEIFFLLFIVIDIIIYFIPSMVADCRNLKEKTQILILNLFLGWTIIGWVVALVWACKPKN